MVNSGHITPFDDTCHMSTGWRTEASFFWIGCVTKRKDLYKLPTYTDFIQDRM